MMTALIAGCTRLWREMNWPVVLVAACLVSACFLLVTQSLPKLTRANQLEEALADLRSSSVRTSAGANGPQIEAPGTTLRKLLRPAQSSASAMADMIELASHHGLSIDRGEYRLTKDQDAALMRYRMSFPVHGRYVDIRRWVRAVLAAIPTMALEEFQVRRTSAQVQEVDAQIQFTLFTHPDRQ